MKPTILITENKNELAKKAVELITTAAVNAVEKRGRFSAALAGGSTPRATYQLLALPTQKPQIPWQHVHLFWGDERCVPPDDNQSNYLMVKNSLLDHVELPQQNIHRMAGELKPQEAAEKYSMELNDFFQGDIRFDLVMLGMGDDGHTASLFPHTEALNTTLPVTANFVPKLDTWRLTLSAEIINAAHQVLFLVAGENKARALAHVLEGKNDPDEYPSQKIKPEDGELIWLIDKTAAANLRNI